MTFDRLVDLDLSLGGQPADYLEFQASAYASICVLFIFKWLPGLICLTFVYASMRILINNFKF